MPQLFVAPYDLTHHNFMCLSFLNLFAYQKMPLSLESKQAVASIVNAFLWLTMAKIIWLCIVPYWSTIQPEIVHILGAIGILTCVAICVDTLKLIFWIGVRCIIKILEILTWILPSLISLLSCMISHKVQH